MTEKSFTLIALDVIDILHACKDLPISRLKFKDLEIDFSFHSAKDGCNINEEQQQEMQQVDMISDQGIMDYQTITDNSDELDMLKVTDPVAYDLALQGVVDDEGIPESSRVK